MSTEPQGTNLEPPASAPKEARAMRWIDPLKRVFDNPVILKELRGRMRSRQAFILLTIYLGLIAGLIGLIYMTAAEGSASTGWDPSLRQAVGKAVFSAVVLLELLLIGFIGPGLTAGTITTERERQTFDLLRTTLLSARSLVLGKLASAFAYLFLLILTALPIESLAFLLGGVGIGEMVVSSVMLVVTAVFFCTLGVFFSSILKRTLTATVSSYGAIVISFLLTLAALMMVVYLEAAGSGPVREFILGIAVWLLISTNPFAAAVMTEIILIDEQSLFFTKNGPFGGMHYLLSPWIIYVVFYLVLSAILILISIRRVERPDR